MAGGFKALCMKRTDAQRVQNTPILALMHDSLTRFCAQILVAATTILRLTLTPSVVVKFAFLSIPVISVLLLILELAFYQVHVKACIMELILPRLRVLHADPHKHVSLLHQHLSV